MENLNQICAKIMSGPQGIYPKVNGESGSVFLEILTMMNHTQGAETVVKENNNECVNGVIVEETDDEMCEVMVEEMIQMLISPTSIPIVLNSENSVDVKPAQTIVTTLPNITLQSVQIESQVLYKPPQKEMSPTFTLVEFESVSTSEKSVKDGQVVQEKDIEIVNISYKTESQKHYKVLNQTLRLKEVIKNDEVIPLQSDQLKRNELVQTKEVELTEIVVNEFKQSIQEMKIRLENLSKKEDEVIVFKLKPEGLAEITIKFEQKLGKVTLDISTSNKMVEQLIQKELPHLKESLKSYQMEVNLNEMNSKNESNQYHHSKPHRNNHVIKLKQDESIEEEWISLPQSYGFNTYG